MKNKFKSIVRSIFINLYGLISRAFPKNEKLIVFMSYPDYSDNSWHLFNYLAAKSYAFRIAWLTVGTADAEKIKNTCALTGFPEKNVVVVKKKSIKGLYLFIRAKYIFHTHGTYWFVKRKTGSVIVNLWHGMPLKKIALLDNKNIKDIDVSDYVVATSRFFSSVMAKAFGIKKSKVLITGLPRNDALFSNALKKRLILERLSVRPCEHFIFWLPTYRSSNYGDIRKDSPVASFIDEWPIGFFEDLNDILKKREITIIIKLHPMDVLNYESLPELEFIRFVTSADWLSINLDIYECLGHSAGLISDVSSVLVDYCLTQKPIGITSNSLDNYSRGVIDGIDIKEINHMKIIDVNSFCIFIDACKKNIKSESCVEKLHQYIDNNSCKRIYDQVFNNLP